MDEDKLIDVLLITYQRPTFIRQIVERLPLNKVRLFIYQNLPSKTGDDNHYKVNKIIKNLKKQINIEYFSPDEHLESRESIKFAINYFFQKVQYGLILEDDCIPHKNFCKAIPLIENITKSERCVFTLFDPDPITQANSSVKFSRLVNLHVWGWYCSRVVWQEFKKFKSSGKFGSLNTLLSQQGLSFLNRLYWRFIFLLVKNSYIKTWDYEFQHFLWHRQIAIYGPEGNLICNKGHDKFATFVSQNNDKSDKYASERFYLNGIETCKPDKTRINRIGREHYKITPKAILKLFLVILKKSFFR